MKLFLSVLDRLQSYAPQSCIERYDGLSHTYANLLQELSRWNSLFDQLKVDPGTVVAIRTDFSASAVAVLLALFARSAVAALIPRDRDSAPYLEHAQASAFLELNVNGDYEWHPLMQSKHHPLLDKLRAVGGGGLVVFTSGSTGTPKAALQSTERFLHKFQRPGRRLRTVAFLLFDHIAGLDTLFYTLANGGTLIVPQRRDPKAILGLIESHAVEVLPTSPSFLRLLCVAGVADNYDLSTLKIITYGSEPMDASTLARLNVRFPNTQISQKYGSTEIGSPKSVSRGNDSLWLKIKHDGVETKVVDDVLWIRSESTILGYLNGPSPLDDEGWYCTGDLVDVEGEWIRFRGRAFEVINVGGEKVAPAEVEHVILELDFVQDVIVLGESHALMGQVVAARVALANSTMEEKEAANRIRLHCLRRLAAYKVPIKIEFSQECFVNNRQKLERKRLPKTS